MNDSEDDHQVLEDARRRAAEKVRSLLLQFEAAEQDLGVATDKVNALRAERRPPGSVDSLDDGAKRSKSMIGEPKEP